MMTQYPIRCNEQIVGTAIIEEYGLFLQIHCKCTLKREGFYHIQMVCEKQTADLGTCLKTAQGYEIRTKLPRKHFGKILAFFLVGESPKGFYPLQPGKPFAHIQMLTRGKLLQLNGQIGIKVQ